MRIFLIIYAFIGLILLAATFWSYFKDGQANEVTKFGGFVLFLMAIYSVVCWPILVYKTIRLALYKRRSRK
jgi:membrane protein YdbS with pleckstrin-like domain